MDNIAANMSLFVWGMGKNGQLGSGHKENLETPVCCTIGTRGVVSVGAGGLYTALVTEDGVVYSTGSGRHGRLGSGDEQDTTHLQCVQALSGKNIKQVRLFFIL